MKSLYPRLVIAGLKGGSGKTMLSLGLIAAWVEKGLIIVPYKKGPDYIDSGWLSSAAGQPCYNLDPFLITKEKVLSSFKEHFLRADCAVIEGNRGLYDGMDSAGTYSTAELSKILKSPVLLILDCTKVTRTASAMVHGIQKFDKKVDIKGVVLNNIAGARHEKIVSEAIERYCNIPVLGSIPKLRQDFLSERHMGLLSFQEHPEVKQAISFTAEIAKKYLDLDRIWEIAQKAFPMDVRSDFKNPPSPRIGALPPRGFTPSFTKGGWSTNRRGGLINLTRNTQHATITIGIIRDSAFQFYYPENFEQLEKGGAKLLQISALKEKKLPEIDALYIGGGFPETHAILLAKNRDFKRSLRKRVEEGLPVYAECGGLMYLGNALELDNKTYPMAGIFPVKFSLGKKPQAHGYTIVEINRKNPFYKKGVVLRGHEFHYSRVVEIESKEGMMFSFKMRRGNGIADKKDGLCYKNVLATYTHLHALGSPEWADGLIKLALLYARRRSKRKNNRIIKKK